MIDGIERLERLQHSAAIGACLATAADLGLFETLASGSLHAEEVCARHGLDPAVGALVLELLAGAGALERDAAGRYASALPGAVPPAILQIWRALPDRLRHGRSALAMDGTDAPRVYPRLVTWMAEAAEETALKLADRVVRDGLDVVDVGAGAAPWSLALARRAAVRVTAVDLAEVLPVTRKAVEAAGLGKVFSFAAHDVLTGPFAHEAFDLAVVANLFHLFGEDDCRHLAAHLHAVLRSGGRIAIVDVVPNGGRTPTAVLSYALGLMLRTTNGRVYPFTAYASWLREAGFRAVERVDLDARHAIAAVLAVR